METLLGSEINESWKMLLGLNTEQLLKPSVGKWELGTTIGELGHKWRMLLPPVRKLYNYRLRGRGGAGAYLGWSHHPSCDSPNAGLWLVTWPQCWPLIGHQPPPPPPHRHMLHALNISTQLSNGQVLYRETLIARLLFNAWESLMEYQLWARMNY